MKSNKNNNSTLFVLKLFLLCFLGICFIIFSSITLKKLCMPSVYAETHKYIKLLSSTPLYNTNNLEKEIITLPKGYYAEVLTKTDSVARVRYNSLIGFIKLDENTPITTTPEPPLFQEAEIKTSIDAGTYLRKSPNSNSDSLVIIPANTPLSYLGEIKGNRPTDGTSEMWFYVHYQQSDTIVYTGYIYSERVNILSGKTDHPITSATTQTNGTPTILAPSSSPDEINLTSPINAGVKIFLAILFSTLGVIIFALLIISPHEKKESRRPNSYGQNKDSFKEKINKNDDFYTKNGDFVPFSAKKLTISGKIDEKHPEKGTFRNNLAINPTKNAEKHPETITKIPSETARGAEFMQKNNKHKQHNARYISSQQNNSETEFASFIDFPNPSNNHKIIGERRGIFSRNNRTKNRLHLLGETKGEPLPEVLTRYFDIED